MMGDGVTGMVRTPARACPLCLRGSWAMSTVRNETSIWYMDASASLPTVITID